MRIVTRMLQREIFSTVGLTCIAFLALMMFFDLIGDSRFVSRSGVQTYGIGDALLRSALSAPMNLYELLPICVLIGTVFVMARYAQTSQFTILRTGGLGPGRALGILLWLGMAFTLVTFIIGDYVAPWSERAASAVRSQHLMQANVTGNNAWLREKQGDDSVVINVGVLLDDGTLEHVRIFRFASNGQLRSTMVASHAQIRGAQWHLQNALVHDYPVVPLGQASTSENTGAEAGTGTRAGATSATPPTIQTEQHDLLQWDSAISQAMVTAAVLRPDGMSTLGLFNYVNHLKANSQASHKYELELWRKVFYPLSCLVMMVLALPFAYLHFRSGGIMGYVFIGIMVGISYMLLNNVLGYMGNLHQWSPLLTAATPGVVYSLASLGAFGWLVLKR